MFFELSHYDTCLPDYFGGHHLPYLQIAVDCNTTAEEVKEQLRSELNQCAIGGNVDFDITASDLFHYLANQSIDDFKILHALPYKDSLEPFEEDLEPVYSYFVLVPNNTQGQVVA